MARWSWRLILQNNVGLFRACCELGAVDRATYEAIAQTPTPSLDDPIRRLSNAANNSRLWLGIAAALAVLGGRRGRRAALEGVVAIGVTSATVNLLAKSLAARPRPHREELELFPSRAVEMPASSSFPSGYAASAFAFSYAIGRHNARARGPGPAPRGRSRLLAGAYRRPLPGRRYRGGDDGIGDCRDAFLARRSPRD